MTLTMDQRPLTLEDLTLQPGDRALLVGMSRQGKSVLAKQYLIQWRKSLWQPRMNFWVPGKMSKRPRTAIIDTKPRWRATIALTGASLNKRYRKMAPGDKIESVICDDSDDWNIVWDEDLNPYKTVIFQNRELEENDLIEWQNSIIRRLFDTQDYNEPTLVYVDEGMDFFGENGASRHGGAIRRNYRGGAERNLTSLTAVQRPVQIQTQIITEANVLDLFYIKNQRDLKRLSEMDVPENLEIPAEGSHEFRHLRNGRLHPRMVRLSL